jgi:hypothetical protein
MMKKVLMVGAMVLASVTSASAIGLGLVANGSWGRYGSGDFGLNVAIGEKEAIFMEVGLTTWFGTKGNPNGVEINLDVPFHLFSATLTDSILFYVGVGPHIGFNYLGSKTAGPVIETKTGRTNWRFGAIMPMGVRFVTEKFDFWIAAVPNGGVKFSRNTETTTALGVTEKNSSNSYGGLYYGVGLQTGLRFWLG